MRKYFSTICYLTCELTYYWLKEYSDHPQAKRIYKLAIKRMIPKGPLGRKQLSNCKIYNDSNHLHEAQNPKILDISKINSKNTLR